MTVSVEAESENDSCGRIWTTWNSNRSFKGIARTAGRSLHLRNKYHELIHHYFLPSAFAMVEAFQGQPEEDQNRDPNSAVKIDLARKADDDHRMRNIQKLGTEAYSSDGKHEDGRLNASNLP